MSIAQCGEATGTLSEQHRKAKRLQKLSSTFGSQKDLWPGGNPSSDLDLFPFLISPTVCPSKVAHGPEDEDRYGKMELEMSLCKGGRCTNSQIGRPCMAKRDSHVMQRTASVCSGRLLQRDSGIDGSTKYLF